MPPKLILVAGATGKQGSALISALRPADTPTSPSTTPDEPAGPESADSGFHILALTRKPTTPSAQRLAREPHVTVVQGDLDDAASVRRVFEDAGSGEGGGVWGVFCVLAFPGLGANADAEERQGKTLADLALEFGVSSFVFSSVERGGESYDDKLVLDRRAKVRIERHVRELGTKGLPWTILRPSFFMENFEGTIGSITAGVLKAGLKPTTTLQLVAVNDIGHVAAGVFKNPDEFKAQILLVVGDILTAPEQRTAYNAATGAQMPSIPAFLARALIALNGHTQGLIADIERVHAQRTGVAREEGEAQMALARRAFGEMTSFGTWAQRVRQKGKGKGKGKEEGEGKGEGNWNQVSIGQFALGKQ